MRPDSTSGVHVRPIWRPFKQVKPAAQRPAARHRRRRPGSLRHDEPVTDDVLTQILALRERGSTPKQIAKVLGPARRRRVNTPPVMIRAGPVQPVRPRPDHHRHDRVLPHQLDHERQRYRTRPGSARRLPAAAHRRARAGQPSQGKPHSVASTSRQMSCHRLPGRQRWNPDVCSVECPPQGRARLHG